MLGKNMQKKKVIVQDGSGYLRIARMIYLKKSLIATW